MNGWVVKGNKKKRVIVTQIIDCNKTVKVVGDGFKKLKSKPKSAKNKYWVSYV